MHKDFIVCYFNGRPPPFNQIQSVFNHMWGKGKKLEIHNNPLTRSVIVRIHSDYLRGKILEKHIWYVGDSMFHTALWTSEHSSSTPPLQSVQLWAHLTGVPLDLRHQACFSLVAGLVGEPKETDEFTKNLVSLTLSHVKVELDLTIPAPSVVEFERESGEVVEVSVTYPWLPPTCSHCKELGHVIRNCLKWTPPKDAQPAEKQPTKQSDKANGEKPVNNNSVNSADAKEKGSTSDQVMEDTISLPPVEANSLVFSSQAPSSKLPNPSPIPKSDSFSLSKSLRLPPKTPSTPTTLAFPSHSLDPFHLSPLGPFDSIAKTATLASLCRNGVWRLPNARSDNQLQFLTFLTTFQLQDGDDYYEWELHGRISNRYSTGEVYRLLRGDQPVVTWKDIVWSSGSIPRHSFLTWLFILDRCPTRDRILSWGLQTDPTCLLCSTEPESRNHLLFNCCFSLSIWTALSRRCSLQALPDWDQTILQLTSLRTGKLHRRLVIIAWEATIYAIWTERNSRLHRSVFCSTDSITKKHHHSSHKHDLLLQTI
ncbi:hypothetical protein Bca4012_032223 [Brassica carinata]